jgi:hypothetical protein
MMTLPQAFNRKLRFAFHSFGLSCLGGAIFLQVLVFSDIVFRGYFMAIEQNATILTLEVGLTGFAAIYFLYVYQRLMRQVK